MTNVSRRVIDSSNLWGSPSRCNVDKSD